MMRAPLTHFPGQMPGASQATEERAVRWWCSGGHGSGGDGFDKKEHLQMLVGIRDGSVGLVRSLN